MWGNPATSQYKRVTGNGLVAAGQHQLSGFLVATGTPTITIYDGTDNTGAKVVDGMVCAAATPYPVPAKLSKGLYVESSGGSTTFFFD